MFTEIEQKILSKYLTGRIEQMRNKIAKDHKRMNNKEFDRICSDIRENLNLIKEIEQN